MAFIQRAGGIPDFSSGVIDIWFNVTQEALDTKTAEWTAWLETDHIDGNLIGVVPLMTFGPNTETAFFPGTMETGNLSPCVVGVLCDNAPGGPHLYVRFQYNYGAPGYTGTINFNDFFQIGGTVGTGVSSGIGQYISVSGDAWHHVVISFDFSVGCATSYDVAHVVNFDRVCPFYLAFDKVNHTGNYLHPGTPSMYGQPAAQGIVSEWSRALAPDPPPPQVFPSSYSFNAGAIPTSGKPFAFPATSERSSHIQKIRLSRPRFWTGVTCDLSDEQNLLAFVTSDGQQADRQLANDLLGKSPEIEFSNFRDISSGRNRGTAGSFIPIGTILEYDGDVAIGG